MLNIEAVCSAFGAGISMSTNNLITSATIAAHELGHVLGFFIIKNI